MKLITSRYLELPVTLKNELANEIQLGGLFACLAIDRGALLDDYKEFGEIRDLVGNAASRGSGWLVIASISINTGGDSGNALRSQRKGQCHD